MLKAEQRTAIITAALSWRNTPFHHAARVKGAGVDCMQFIAAVYEEAGILPPIPIAADYPPDWFMHRSDEKIVDRILQYFEPVDAPSPGDVVLFRLGRAVSHGAIVLAWPTVIHAVAHQSVVQQDITSAPRFARSVDSYWMARCPAS